MSTAARANPGLIELGRKNQAGGYVGIDGSGNVIGTFVHRTGNSLEISSIVLANGELAYATDTKEIFIGDGITPGGIFFRQKVQVQRKDYGALAAAPGFPSPGTISAASMVFPKYAGTYGIYKLTVIATFGGGSESLSNFAIEINPRIDTSLGDQVAFEMLSQKASWGVGNDYIETHGRTNGSSVYDIFSLANNLTLNDAHAVIEIEYIRTTDTLGSPGPFTVTACRRLAGTATTAYASVTACCERIA